MSQKQSSEVILDIETDGLLLDLTTMWVGVTLDINTEEERVWYDPKELMEYLNKQDKIIGHNIIGFDLPALTKLTDITLNSSVSVVDTLILAKLVYYDKDSSWGHSLDAYGERLRFAKGSHSDWSKYSKEMEEYCIRDCKVTLKLYRHLQKKGRWLPRKALEFEQEVQKIITQQYLNGWVFDLKKAQELHIELVEEMDQATDRLFQVFKPMFLPQGKVFYPKKPFKRSGTVFEGPHQKIKLTQFNPGSGKHIVWWIERLYGRQDWKRTEKGTPKTDAETLQEMFSGQDWAEPLLHYQEVAKIMGQLATGPKAWLKLVRDDGKIHHRVDILGTNTGRATHSDPNLAQVPSVRAYKGKEARALFTVDKGNVLVGCDLSGVELRCLSHYLYKYDGGKYAEEILKGDIHTANQKAAGLPTRDQAKTFIYAFLYGAGSEKIGGIIHKDGRTGQAIKQRFLRKIPGLSTLLSGIKEAAKRGYLIGITGRRLQIRSPHSAPNVLLQSLGAYIAKQWMITAHKNLEKEGLCVKQVGWIHDEVQIECKKEDAEKVAKILEESATEAGEILKIRMRIDAEATIGSNWAETH